jgi:hypothetical protein
MMTPKNTKIKNSDINLLMSELLLIKSELTALREQVDTISADLGMIEKKTLKGKDITSSDFFMESE